MINYLRVNVQALQPDALLDLLSQQQTLERQAITQLAAMAYDEWVRLAQTELKTSSVDYIGGLWRPVINGSSATLVLEGVLPNMIEQGWDARDMRQTLCFNPNAGNRKPIYRDRDEEGNPVGSPIGWYNIIPFRHGNPNAGKRNFFAMGQAYRARGLMTKAAPHYTISSAKKRLQLGRSVYKVAKKLGASTRDPRTGRTRWGGRLAAGTAPKLREHHATDIYAGMVRNAAGYSQTLQGHYTTFRVISTMEPTGWQHPGISARHFADEVSEHLGRVAETVISDMVGQVTA